VNPRGKGRKRGNKDLPRGIIGKKKRSAGNTTDKKKEA